jgi:hypothetical protein
MMSQSRFVLKQIHVRGGGNSDLTRYVAKSKLDAWREGRGPRPLFNERDDYLSASEARNFLSITGGELKKDDVLHYVLSFSDEREYQLLGDDKDEQRREVAGYFRRSLQSAFAATGISKARWIAGVHRNTDNPHIHLLLNKNVIEKETEELIRIAKLPNPLIPHHFKLEEGASGFTQST